MKAVPKNRLILYSSIVLFFAALLSAPRFIEWLQRFDREGWVESRTENSVELLSGRYQIRGYFPSMLGPSSNLPKILLATDTPLDETIWLTGVESEVVADDTTAPISAEYFCHANLTFSPGSTTPEAHNASFDSPKHQDWRLFTLVPGRMQIELPDGFGIPVRNTTAMDFYTMSLNQNPGTPGADIRMRSRVHFVREQAVTKPIRPLFRRALYVYQQFQDLKPRSAAAELAKSQQQHTGEACALESRRDQRGAIPSSFGADPTHPGASCCVKNASEGGVMEQFGPENTIHWIVPPGSHAYQSEVSEQFELPFDTTAHYVTGHLHPYGRSLRLIDLESGEPVFEIVSEDFHDKIGVERMSEVRSTEGVWLQHGGRYRLICEYENPTDKPIDAMAILYVYLAEEPDPNGGKLAGAAAEGSESPPVARVSPD